MMKIRFHRQFRKDLLGLRRSGWDMAPFEAFLDVLEVQWPLPPKYEAHMLRGDRAGMWYIHLRQNWIVFLKREGTTITLLRTGTHAMLGLE